MMAVQGFDDTTIEFDDANQKIIVTNGKGETNTITFGADGSITETFVGEKTIVKTTSFDGNIISEVIS
jgi:hypothetical protein